MAAHPIPELSKFAGGILLQAFAAARLIWSKNAQSPTVLGAFPAEPDGFAPYRLFHNCSSGAAALPLLCIQAGLRGRLARQDHILTPVHAIIFMGEDIEISKPPLSMLFNAAARPKDAWEIDLVLLLDILMKKLEASGKKDLRKAGMAALTSSIIYRSKVESISRMQQAAMEKKPLVRRTDVDIELIEIPYRHESTYPVSLDDLLGMLENLIVSIEKSRQKARSSLEPEHPPAPEEHLVHFEDMVRRYEQDIAERLQAAEFVLFQDMIKMMDELDSVRCFFACLFMAGRSEISLEEIEGDIKITPGSSPLK